MEKNNGGSNSILMEQINPLNLKSSYNDNIVALKILLNLCDNDEVRNLGQQILDSFILLNLLKSNIGIKQYHDEYSVLTDKLHTFINKYMHFEKLLRESDVRTFSFVTSKYNIDDTKEVGKEASDAVENENAYIIIKSKESGKSYSLNEILKESNLFKTVLCKDKKRKFKDEITNNILNNNKKQQEIKNSAEVEELCANKKNTFVKIVTTDDLSDEQLELFNLIEEEFKQLLLEDNRINLHEKFIDRLMSQTFVLDPKIAKMYIQFKEICEKDYEESIKLRAKLIEKIKIDLATYESILNTPKTKKSDVKITSEDNELYEMVASLYKNFLLEQINNRELENIKFSEYLETIGCNEEIITYVKDKEKQEQQKYVEYLINKLGDTETGHKIEQPVMSFSGRFVA